MDGMTQQELSELAGITVRQLREINRALPEERKLFVRADGGHFDGPLFVQRYIAYRVEQAAKKNKGFDAVRTEHEVIKAEKTRLQVLKMRGDMVDTAEVMRLWGDVVNTFKQSLLQIPAAISQTIQGMTDAGQIARVLEEELRASMTELSRADAPAWTQEAGEDDAEEETEDAE